ncbi:hypothetical protein B4N89_47245 [Embleya scabrispora]|uniref:Type I restriction modification DNA specificity domain-containing protein n=1 Tax=Embleya scabrispora TaxID=159449 RepID=A0A1T3NHZ1_9ACTN|nr:hypothetical protein [Embleya scabrispora]OPC76454.1 hypothetical protein B4N89_47245 [Embleya scabrispora]
MSGPDADAGRTPPSSEWSRHALSELLGVASVTYGVVDAGQHVSDGVPLLQAGNIVGGVVDDRIAPMRISASIDATHSRTRLRSGDLVVVLIGRVGETAIVTDAHDGWNVARSVGVVKFTDSGRRLGIGAWLHGWLRTPTAREWCRRKSDASAHSTLNIAALRALSVPLPPEELRLPALRMMDLIDRRSAVNREITERALELADAHFARWRRRWLTSTQRLGAVALVSGGGSPRSSASEGVAWVSPAEILRSDIGCLDRTAKSTSADAAPVRAPGTLLLAPRPGMVRTVMSRIAVVPARGIAALYLDDEADRMWLLHELRSRSEDLARCTQGEQAREMSVRRLSGLDVCWPDRETRERFAEVAIPLHERAYTASTENRVLEAMNVSVMIPDAEQS